MKRSDLEDFIVEFCSWMVVIAIVTAVLLFFSSCRTKYITTEVVKTDSVYIYKEKNDSDIFSQIKLDSNFLFKHIIDSIYIHDSIYVREKVDGSLDTYHDKVTIRYKYLHDSIYVHRFDSAYVYKLEKDVDSLTSALVESSHVEIEKGLSLWQRIRLKLFTPSAILNVLFLALGAFWVKRKFF